MINRLLTRKCRRNIIRPQLFFPLKGPRQYFSNQTDEVRGGGGINDYQRRANLFRWRDPFVHFKPAIQEKEDRKKSDDEFDEVNESNDDDGSDDDDDSGDQPSEKFTSNEASKTLLGLSKVRYRHAEPLPLWIRERSKEVTEKRSYAQLRRCVKSWMVKSDINKMQVHRFRPLGWVDNELAEQPQQSRAKSGVVEGPGVYGPEETVAYMSTHYPGRYTILSRLLSDIKTMIPDFSPISMLDYGSGPGTATMAFVSDSVKPNKKNSLDSMVYSGSVKSYTALDASKSMLDATKIMTRGLFENAVYLQKSTELLQRALNTGTRYDLIVCSYVLSELATDSARLSAVQLLYELLSPDGIMLVVEAGDPYGSHTVRSARQHLLNMTATVDNKGQFRWKKGENKKNEDHSVIMLPPTDGNFEDFGLKVLAPCTHDKACPLADNNNKSGRWCSFSQRLPATGSSLIRKHSEEKFSYVILQKIKKRPKLSSPTSQPPSVEVQQRIPIEQLLTLDQKNILQYALAENRTKEELKEIASANWESYKHDFVRENWGRIIRSPLKAEGHVNFDLCLSSGRDTRATLSRAQLSALPGLYVASRRASWGGLFPLFSTRLTRVKEENNIEINQATKKANSREKRSIARGKHDREM